MKCPRCKKGELFYTEYDILVIETALDEDGTLLDEVSNTRKEDSIEIACNNCSFRIDVPENYTEEIYAEKIKLIKEQQ